MGGPGTSLAERDRAVTRVSWVLEEDQQVRKKGEKILIEVGIAAFMDKPLIPGEEKLKKRKKHGEKKRKKEIVRRIQFLAMKAGLIPGG